jgi:hypothetical protein
MTAFGSLNKFLNLACVAGVIFYLCRYFAFVGYDLEESRPASVISIVWNILLAVGFPLTGLRQRFSEETNRTLVAIGISTILVLAIFPEQKPPKASSALEWIYFQTLGKVIVNLFENGVIAFVLFVCWRFGSLWVAAYAGIAMFFGVARASSLLVQEVPDPVVAAPPVRRMFMMFAVAFGWVTVLSVWLPLKEGEVHAEISELFKPYLAATCVSWLLGRLPRFLRPLLPKG